MRMIAVTCIFLFLPVLAFGDTHYVSHTGSDTYPYTFWMTAANSIQKGINAASYGDTVRVGAGRYRRYNGLITMIPGIALIGAGMDSCTIGEDCAWPAGCTLIQGADSAIVEGFSILGFREYAPSSGIRANGRMKITNNKFSNFDIGIYFNNTNVEISNNIFGNNWICIDPSEGRGLIIGNTFTRNNHAMWSVGCYDITFAKNVITDNTDAIYADFVDSVFIENNLIVSGEYYGIWLSDWSGQFKCSPITNNVIIGNYNHVAVSIVGFSNEIKNNIISQGSPGIMSGCNVVYVGGFPFEWYCGTPRVSYNNMWNNVQNYARYIDTSAGGNIYSDPMFVENGDYHLQFGSPCIDAGDPNIKDPDSSRSDIGCYGGTWGETYMYQDYPPKAPDSLSAISESTVIILSWKRNTESDLSHYLVYKDTITWFAPDTSKIVGIISKDSSVFRDHDFVLGETYYYRITAWDLTGHQSNFSVELEVQATSASEYTEEDNRPPMYRLSQNYPNPFNSSTVIWYYLPDVGYQPAEVEINIYNILGRKVRTLVHERKYPGRHMATWDGKDDSDNDLSSGIYFYKLKFSGVDLSRFIKPKKMTLIR